MSLMDENTLLIFIEESLEHLGDIENELIEIEERGANFDLDLVNKVFRALHSVKGGAGFMGFKNIKELSHAMENVLNLIRTKELVPDPDIISVLLSSADLLRKMLNNYLASEDEDISIRLEELNRILDGESGEQQPGESIESKSIAIKTETGRELFSLDSKTLKKTVTGKYLYLLKYDAIKDIEDQDKVAFDIMQTLQNIGIVVQSTVDIEAVMEKSVVDEASLVMPFYVLFATIIGPGEIAALLELDKSSIVRLDDSIFEEQPVAATSKKIETKKESAAVKEVPKKDETPAVKQKEQPPKNDKSSAINVSKKESSLRVNTSLLDKLMTLAGELVLTRNQLLQSVTSDDKQKIELASKNIDLITSDLQESVMATRMQPTANVFGKFKRIVREISKVVGKNIDLELEGEDVELDKTIIEMIGDPLTHLVRNAADHGIESPEERLASGKKEAATVKLRAFHEAGKVVIEVTDDGRGINYEKIKEKAIEKKLFTPDEIDKISPQDILEIVFHPGFSTASEVSDISGRGVGMDVVQTNIKKLGGTIEIRTEIGKGTTFRIKLPLTLAIILALLIEIDGQKYAIPQVNIVELVRVPASQIKNRIKYIGETIVLKLRGDLLPLVSLYDIMNSKKETFIDPKTGQVKKEKRARIVDRRSIGEDVPEEIRERRKKDDRRYSSLSAYNIVVLNTGDFYYGIIVDQLLDSEEIVVKPLGYHLQKESVYAGATILGDGHIAMILDVIGISSYLYLHTKQESISREVEEKFASENLHSFLIITNGHDEQFAIQLNMIARIEKISKSALEIHGGRLNIKYKGTNLPIFSVEEVVNVAPKTEKEFYYVVVSQIEGREVGILFSEIVDVVSTEVTIDEHTFSQPGVIGSFIIENTTTLLLDIKGIVRTIHPSWFDNKAFLTANKEKKQRVVLAEDSTFFREQISTFLLEAGYEVDAFENGLLALGFLEKNHERVDIVITDINMPEMDGLEFTRAIKNSNIFKEKRVIAVTSLSGDEDVQKGIEAGVDSYLVKIDREKILKTLKTYLDT